MDLDAGRSDATVDVVEVGGRHVNRGHGRSECTRRTASRHAVGSCHEGKTPGRINVVVMDATVRDAVAVGRPMIDMAAGSAVAGEHGGRSQKSGGGGCRARCKFVEEE